MNIILTVIVYSSLVLDSLVYSVSEDIVIDLLVLVPWPTTNYSGGLGTLAGGRIAVEEINNTTGLLPPGYKINIIEGGHDACDATIQSLGLVNLVHFGIHPNNDRNVGAILGLFCSTSTESLSLLAGRDEIDFLQLSSANSPIFNQRIDQYPHLWKFLQSAGIYADMMIYLMVKYDWNRIGIISSEGNTYHNGIANILIKMVSTNNNTILYFGNLIELESEIEDQVISGLIGAQARVVFITANTLQVVSFLCSAYDKGMVYPNYLWIIPDETLDSLLLQSTCGNTILKSLEGSIMLTTNILPKYLNEITIETSNISFNQYIEKYDIQLEQVKRDYSSLVMKTGTEIYGLVQRSAMLYDQVWAFSIALSNALPELIEKKSTFKFGESIFTHIMEKHLSNLSFKGASGLVQFNDFRELSTPIDVYQVINGNSTKVGDRINIDTFNEKISIVLSDELDDEVLIIHPVLHWSIITTMALCTLLLFIMTTVVLFVMLKYRDEHEIKAISPKLSLFIYLGCYILIVIMIIRTIEGSLPFIESKSEVFCHMSYILETNALNLIFVTLYLKLKRVHKIFNNRKLIRLGWQYTTKAIILQVIIIVSFSNILYIILVASSPERTLVTIVQTQTTVKSVTVINEYDHCYSTNGISFISIFGWFTLVFYSILAILIVYLASSLTKVPSTDFKNTKHVNILVVLISTTFAIITNLIWFFFTTGEAALYINVMAVISLMLTVLYCQLLLFIPSVITVIKRKCNRNRK